MELPARYSTAESSKWGTNESDAKPQIFKFYEELLQDKLNITFLIAYELTACHFNIVLVIKSESIIVYLFTVDAVAREGIENMIRLRSKELVAAHIRDEQRWNFIPWVELKLLLSIIILLTVPPWAYLTKSSAELPLSSSQHLRCSSSCRSLLFHFFSANRWNGSF